jgi:alkylation response protein AidB-like acyl-CoA dehydrogenase
VATRHGDRWRLSGNKEFCSGAGRIDRALVSADAADGYRLFDVDLRAPGVEVVAGSWPAVGMADSASFTVSFVDVALERSAAVGQPGFYLERPGFWFGAAGVAACWFGGARALVGRLTATTPPDAPDVALVDLGRSVAELWAMDAALAAVAAGIDGDPTDRHGRIRADALALRQTVHRGCSDILRWTADAGGARPLGHDREQSRRAADLYVYLSQHHGARDAVAVARAAVAEAARGR